MAENLSFGREIIKASVSEEMQNIKIPTLLIWGKLDIISPPQVMMQDALQNLKNAPKIDTLLLDNAAHAVMYYTVAPQLIHKVREFVKGI